MTANDKRQKPIPLDMEWDEALRRLIQADPDELPESVKLKRKAGRKKRPARESDPKGDDRGDR